MERKSVSRGFVEYSFLVKEKNAGIEILRFLAANMVLLFHFGAVGSLPKYNSEREFEVFSHITRNFYSGVDLFFVISGFVIASIVAQRKYSAWTFIRRRAARLLPSYILVTTLIYLIDNLFFDTFEFAHYFCSIALLAGLILDSYPVLPQGWTLEYEAFFYIVSAFIMNFKYRTILLFAITSLYIFMGGNTLVIEFGLGAFGYYLTWRFHHWLKARKKIICALGIALLFIGTFCSNGNPRELVFGFPSLILVLGLSQIDFKNKKVLQIGAYSYSLYLWHYASVSLFFKTTAYFKITTSSLLIFSAIFILSINFLAYLYYQKIEKKLVKSLA